uniref:Uncharacterized protein n=1 Tax=Arundo donax TaxID=35708 RepID=A0A0A9BG14_ARUDO
MLWAEPRPQKTYSCEMLC